MQSDPSTTGAFQFSNTTLGIAVRQASGVSGTCSAPRAPEPEPELPGIRRATGRGARLSPDTRQDRRSAIAA